MNYNNFCLVFNSLLTCLIFIYGGNLVEKRKRLLSKLSVMILVYLGVCFLVISLWYSYRETSIYYDPFYSEVFFELLKIFGSIFILSGVVIEVYRRLSIKIDALSTFSMIGVEKVIPLRDFRIEKIFSGNKKIKIIINVDENHSFRRLLQELGYAEEVKRIQIIMLGESRYVNRVVLDKFYDLRANSIEVKAIEKSGIENIIILDERTYVVNLSAIDNNLNYVISINNYSEHGVKSEELFEDLWNEGNAVSIR